MLVMRRIRWIRHRRGVYWAFFGSAVVVAAVVVWAVRHWQPASEEYPLDVQVRAAMGTGEYSRALQLLDRGLKREPGNTQLVEIRRQFDSPLHVDVQFLRGKPTASSGSMPYAFLVTLPEQCFLFVFRFVGSDEVEMLFPTPVVQNPLPAGTWRIPQGNEQWLQYQGNGHTIYLVAARWRVGDLERLGTGIVSVRDQGQKQRLIEQLRARLAIEESFGPKLGGLVSGHYPVTESVRPH